MADKGWKQLERRLAHDLGVERIPVTGLGRHTADILQPPFAAYQVKLRRSIPLWLGRWLSGIVATAKVDGLIGVLVLKRPRQPDTEALVVLRWDDWVSLHGNVQQLRFANGSRVEFWPSDQPYKGEAQPTGLGLEDGEQD